MNIPKEKDIDQMVSDALRTPNKVILFSYAGNSLCIVLLKNHIQQSSWKK